MLITSWNVNGVRAASRNGMLTWLAEYKPDVFCLQETKAHPDDIDEPLKTPPGYASLWQPAEKKGYSGVGFYYRRNKPPVSVSTLGVERFDREGRVQVIELKDLTVINAYFPNSQAERARLGYKLDFCETLLKYCNDLRAKGRHVLVCGDYNIAHSEIELARPKTNQNSAGYYIEERQFMDRFLKAGYVDTFRHFTKEPGHYTWWSYRSGARPKNIGWRIDCHCVNEELIDRVKSSVILCDVHGSDHCPVTVALK